MAKSGFEVVNVPVPVDDIGPETQRSLNRILALRVRIIVIHAEPTIAKLMMSTAHNAGILNGDVSRAHLPPTTYSSRNRFCRFCG
jgi:hypothetical protein